MRRSLHTNVIGHLSTGCAPYVVVLVLIALLSLGAAARVFTRASATQVSASN